MKIAIIDSGVHPDHPHVGSVAGGVGVTLQGLTDDFTDRLGHGTAVAGAIREKIGRDAELYAVKVFGQRLTANIDVILRALAWCSDQRMDLINLSLGTSNPAHRERFERVLANAPLVVGAAHSLPGDLPAVIGVAPDVECPRDSYRYQEGVFYASPFPRPIPGVPPEHNLNGVSFAVANMTGLIARFLIGGEEPWSGSRDEIHAALVARAGSIAAP
jgi:hypothetical protein